MRFKRSRFVIPCILILLLLLLIIFPALGNENNLEKLENDIETIRITENIPSIQASIILDNKHIWTGQFGNGTKNTSYMIGSVQKIFTSTAILLLLEQGKIQSLDDDINQYLPFKIINPLNKEITLTFRMLLAHRSGLTKELPYQFFWDTNGSFSPKYRPQYDVNILSLSPENYFKTTLLKNGSYYYPTNWAYEPDIQYHYSPSGYVLLTYLIEQISGKNIDEYMSTYIFKPLDMNHTGLIPTEKQATPYTYVSEKIEELPIWTGKYMVRSTCEDMTKFMLTLINDGIYQEYRLLNETSIEIMRTSHTDIRKTIGNPFSDPTDFQMLITSYGLGWITYSLDIEGHGGSVPGFLTYFLVKDGKSGMNGIVLMMNLNVIFGTPNDQQQINTVFGKIRNVLLLEADMLSSEQIILHFFQNTGISLLIISLLIISNIVIWPTTDNKPSKIENLYKVGWFFPLIILTMISIRTIHGENEILQLSGIGLTIISLFHVLYPISVLRTHGNVPKGKNYGTTSKVVTENIYNIMRHPQYTGLIILTVSIILIYQTMISIILGGISVIFVILLIYTEEKDLIQRFGNEYIEYKNKTPLFLINRKNN